MPQGNLRHILVVDDEPHIISAVRRELKAPPHDIYCYEVEGFSDPRLALQRCAETVFDAVISDYRMPGLDGVEFLGELAKLQPDCARIVLSGQTDTAALVRMVNDIRVFHFITKPWNPYFLKGALGQALDYRDALLEYRHLAAQPPVTDVALSEATCRLLVVDDDPATASAIDRTLRPLARSDDEVVRALRTELGDSICRQLGGLKVEVLSDASMALQRARECDFACIISDQNMPGMKGVDLLKRFAVILPDCARILISGGIAQEDLVSAVNATHIFAFVEKPWNDFELKKSVLLALSRRRMLIESRRLEQAAKGGQPPLANQIEIDVSGPLK